MYVITPVSIDRTSQTPPIFQQAQYKITGQNPLYKFSLNCLRGTFPVLFINSSRLSCCAEPGLGAPLSSYLKGALYKLIYRYIDRPKGFAFLLCNFFIMLWILLLLLMYMQANYYQGGPTQRDFSVTLLGFPLLAKVVPLICRLHIDVTINLVAIKRKKT